MTETEPASLLAKGRKLWRDGEYHESLALFDQAVASIGSASARLALAKGLIAMGRYGEAVSELQRAREMAPEDREAVFVNALGLVYVGESELAYKELVRLVRRHPYFESARIALWQLGQTMGRADALEARLREFPATDLEAAQCASMEIVGLEAVWMPFASQVLLHGVSEAESIDGIVVECGVFHGRSLGLISARTAKSVHGFDSFRGLPEAWGHLPKGSYSTSGQQPAADANVVFHEGWFDDTLPAFVKANPGTRISLLHVDCDLYSSTVCALRSLEPLFADGVIVVFDDLLGFPDFREHEFRAMQEFLATGWAAQPLAATMVGREAAFRFTRA